MVSIDRREAQHSAPATRRAPASLPCIIRAPLQLLLYDMLKEDDGFVDTIRKAGLCLGLVVGMLVPPSVAGSAWSQDRLPLAVYTTCALLASIAWLSSYFVVRLTSCSPRTTVTVLLIINAALSAIAVPCTMDYPFPVTFVLSVMLAALFNVPGRAAWMAGCAVPYLVAAYNHAVRSSQFDFPPLLLDGTANSDLTAPMRLGPWVATYFFTVVIAAAFYAMHDEYARSIERAAASANAAKAVATMLARYDTPAARAVLLEASQPADHPAQAGPPSSSKQSTDQALLDDGDRVCGADETLVMSLATIVSNLEAYRPHLPNWMVDAAFCARSTDDDDETDRGTAETTSARSCRSSHRSGNGSRKGNAATPNPDVFTWRTAAVVRARLRSRVLRGAGDASDITSLLSSFVDIVHAAARNTKAAVHSFIGDTVEVSWNAAADVPAAKGKCLRFMAQMFDAAAPLANAVGANGATLRVGGGAIACRAKIQMAGRDTQQALLISIGEQQEAVLSRIAAVGLEHGAFLAVGDIAATALDVRCCPVATLPCFDGDGGGAADVVPVCQVFDRVDAATMDSPDWLFAQHGAADAPDADSPCSLVAVDGGGGPPIVGDANAAGHDDTAFHVHVARAFALFTQRGNVEGARRTISRVGAAMQRRHPLVGRFVDTLHSSGRAADPHSLDL
eukprot:CAMPEP_0174850804 /NCGR_PEP_ID=MMETSP1114-20130205/21149_1 /TAXON_ID=312471 /ORGANISM="Neobodo designis, Strain CCAP 1951/1" /LENGTH=676 /DNA_ID=CAMNT_0016085291 /DNA_START=44 /DNA_END=2074 /DNA_ORIENTATION=-